jgi:hypothetical protein
MKFVVWLFYYYIPQQDEFYKKNVLSFTKQLIKILLGGFKAILEKEDIFKPTTGNEILY